METTSPCKSLFSKLSWLMVPGGVAMVFFRRLSRQPNTDALVDPRFNKVIDRLNRLWDPLEFNEIHTCPAEYREVAIAILRTYEITPDAQSVERVMGEYERRFHAPRSDYVRRDTAQRIITSLGANVEPPSVTPVRRYASRPSNA